MTTANGEPSEWDRQFAKAVAWGCPILIFLGLGLFGVSHYLDLWSDTTWIWFAGAVPVVLSLTLITHLWHLWRRVTLGRDGKTPADGQLWIDSARKASGLSGIAVALAAVLCGVMTINADGETNQILVLGAPVIAWFILSGITSSGAPHKGDFKWTKVLRSVGLLKSVQRHWQLISVFGYAYLSLAGWAQTWALLQPINLPPSLYVSPTDFAFAILSHPVVTIVTIVALLLLTWTIQMFAGLAGMQERQRRWWCSLRNGGPWLVRSGLSILQIPSRVLYSVLQAKNVLLGLVLLTVPMAISLYAGASAYDDIANGPTGRLTISRPPSVLHNVIHVASTATSAIFVTCTMDDGLAKTEERTESASSGADGQVQEEKEANCSDGSASTVGHRIKCVRDHLMKSASSWLGASPARTTSGCLEARWKPIVVPWSSVASFDTGYFANERADGATDAVYSADGTVWSPQAEANSRFLRFRAQTGGWHPRIGALFAGTPSKEGEWVSVRYSTDGQDWSKTTDDEGVRYAQFRVGGVGEWQPPNGFVVGGSEEDFLDYSVQFESHGLGADPVAQLSKRTALPVLPDGCAVTVFGCASTEPFFQAWETNEAVFMGLAGKYPDECPSPNGQCLDRVNGDLNCGLANLRALSVAMELVRRDKEWLADAVKSLSEPPVDGEGLDLLRQRKPYDQDKDRLTHALLLKQACRIGPGDPNDATSSVTFLGARSDAHTCWEVPPITGNDGAPYNRSVVIRVSRGPVGGPSCLTRDERRLGGPSIRL